MAHQTDSDQLFPDHPAVTTMKFVCIFVTVVGNGLVILAVSTNRIMRQVPSSMFVCSLAVADFLVGAVLMPADTLSTIMRGKEEDDTLESVLLFRFRLFLILASVWNLCIISYDRHFFITKHRDYASWMRRHRVAAFSSVGWICGVFCTLLWHIFHLDAFDAYPEIIPIFCNIFYVVLHDIPMLIILLMYARIMYFLSRLNASCSVPAERNICCVKFRRHPWKQTLLLSALILSLYLSLSPSAVYFHWAYIWNEKGDPDIFHATNWIAYSNSAVNPFLYAMVKARLRNSIVGLVQCGCSDTVSHTEPIRISADSKRVTPVYSSSWTVEEPPTIHQPRDDQANSTKVSSWIDSIPESKIAAESKSSLM